jgi:hypothetical protein
MVPFLLLHKIVLQHGACVDKRHVCLSGVDEAARRNAVGIDDH